MPVRAADRTTLTAPLREDPLRLPPSTGPIIMKTPVIVDSSRSELFGKYQDWTRRSKFSFSYTKNSTLRAVFTGLAGCFYRAASSVFEVFPPKRATRDRSCAYARIQKQV